jgi:hypothetical protein
MKLLFLLVLSCQSVFAAVVSTGQCAAYTASNTQGAIQNYVNCEISVLPGDILHVSTCNSFSGDTYLRLFDPSNTTELVKGDDGCGGAGGTDLTYVVPIAYPNAGVNLHLRQGCFSTHTCGGVSEYTVNIEANPIPYPTTAPADDDRYFDARLCPVEKCLSENHPEKGWNRCDMCICRDFDKIFLSDHDHDCNADEGYYMCMVKYDVKSVTCTTEMKPGWIAAFFFIGFCGFVCFASAFTYIFYLLCFARPNKPIHPVDLVSIPVAPKESLVVEVVPDEEDDIDPAILKERSLMNSYSPEP